MVIRLNKDTLSCRTCRRNHAIRGPQDEARISIIGANNKAIGCRTAWAARWPTRRSSRWLMATTTQATLDRAEEENWRSWPSLLVWWPWLSWHLSWDMLSGEQWALDARSVNPRKKKRRLPSPNRCTRKLWTPSALPTLKITWGEQHIALWGLRGGRTCWHCWRTCCH